MCGPMVAIQAVGLALSAYGQYQQGQAAEEQAEYQAAVQRNNSIIAERNAQDALKRGEVEAQQHRRRVAALQGEQRAQMAASGVTLDDGSPLDILSDTAGQGEFDVLTIQNNAEREAYQHRVRGTNARAQAGLFESEGDAAARAGTMSAGTTLLTGGSKIARENNLSGSGDR